jgi:outer membrane protein TolC
MATAWNLVVGIACVCVCGTARAEVVRLADLEARALAQRPELAASQARIRQAGAEIDIARSAYYPQLSANIDASIAPGSELITYRAGGREYLISGTQTLEEPGAFVPQPRYGASLAARGSLYDFGRTDSAIAAARAKQRASEADERARAQSLLWEVRAAYLRWAVAHALWEIAEGAQAAARARADRVAGLIAEGAAPAASQTPAASQANAAALEAERAALELDAAKLELGFLSARDLGPEAVPEPQLLATASQPAAAADTDGESAVVEAIEAARAAAEARRAMEARAQRPVLGYRLNAGVQGQDAKLFPVYALGIGLSLPLWDGGATAAAEAAASAAAAELSAQAEVERARQKHQSARRTLHASHAEKLLVLAEQALALADKRMAQLEGGETLGEAAQEALAEADVARTRARAELVQAQAGLARLRLDLP